MIKYTGVPIPPLSSTSGFQFLISSSWGVRSTTARSKMIVLSSAPGRSDANAFFVSSTRPMP